MGMDKANRYMTREASLGFSQITMQAYLSLSCRNTIATVLKIKRGRNCTLYITHFLPWFI